MRNVIHRIGRLILLMIPGMIVAASVGCGQSRDRSAPDGGTESREAHGLHFISMPVRTEVQTDGPLLVEIQIHNESTSPIEFQPAFNVGGHWLRADIVDSAGAPVDLTLAIFDPYYAPTTLDAGGVLRDTIDLRCHTGVWTGSPEDCAPPYDGLYYPGTYTITMIFTVPCTSCAEYPELVAQPFTVHVTEPDSAGA